MKPLVDYDLQMDDFSDGGVDCLTPLVRPCPIVECVVGAPATNSEQQYCGSCGSRVEE